MSRCIQSLLDCRPSVQRSNCRQSRGFEHSLRPHPHSLVDWKKASRFPDKPAIKFLATGELQEEATTINYRQLLGAINQTANLLHEQGVEIGGTIFLVLPNLPQTHFAMWGAEALGVVNPINPMLESQAIVCLGPLPQSNIWQKIFTIADQLPQLKCILQVNPLGKLNGVDYPETTLQGIPILDFNQESRSQNPAQLNFERSIALDDIAAYFHTGGTTGTPKLAGHSHGNQIFMAGSASIITRAD